MLIPWKENGRRTGPAAKIPEKFSTCLNLGQINRCNLQVMNIPRFFGPTGLFCATFSPKPGALGAKLCRNKKISATLLTKVIDISNFTPIFRRRDPALTPVCSMFVPFMCRFAARRPPRQAVPCRITLVYGREKEISSKDGRIDPEISSKSLFLKFF
jgi:hypothetical protein